MTKLRMAALAILVTAACGDDECSATDPDCNGTVRTLVLVSGNNQVGAVDAALPDPLVVRVEDSSGNPADGVSVTWALQSAAGAGATLSASSSTSGTDGQTSITFTLGDAAGAYEVRASIAGSTVTFTAEATTSGALQISTGNGQVGQSGARLAQPLVVKAVGAGGIAVPGIEVAFSVTESQGVGAAVDPSIATTNASGLAQTSLTLGDANGPVRVSASANGSTLQLSAYACGGDAAATTLELAPGEDAVLTGPELNCLQLPAHSAGAEYEVTVTPLPQALGFNSMALAVAGSGAAAPTPVAVRDARASAGFSVLGGTSGITDWRARQYEWDRQIREMEQPLRPQIRANAVRGGGFGLMAAPQVGDVLDFGFSCVTETQFPNAPSSVTAKVVEVSNNAVVFEDTLAPGSFTAGEYATIAQNFDDVIIGTDTLYFGPTADVPGDIAPGQVLILYTAGVNRMTENYTEGFIAGFFCPLDLGFAGGNDAKMFYLLVPDPTGDLTPGSDANVLTKTNVLRFTDNTVAHELQHLINAQTGAGAAQDVWLNEGLSHLAEEVVGHATAQAAGLANFAPGNELGPADFFSAPAALEVLNKYYLNNWVNLALYLAEPADTAALLNSEDPIGMNTFRMRGTAWSFVRYLLDRFGAPATEWQKTRQLITEGAATSRAAVGNVFGVPFNDLAADWSAMFTTEDRNDLGGTVRPELEMTSYQVRDIYDDPGIGAVISPSGDYPLRPIVRSLGGSSSVPLDLFTATSEYFTLRATAATGGTGLRLMSSAGGDLSASIAPYMVIVRTK